MKQLLVEGVQGSVPFIVDRTKAFVKESSGGKSKTTMSGRLSVCDTINGNKRRYGKAVWEKNLQPTSTLKTLIGNNEAYGLLEHPKDGVVTCESPIAIRVINVSLQEGPDKIWEVVGEIEILNTPEGNKLMAMIEGDHGWNPRVSSRGFGSLEKGQDGVDNVCDDYVCEGWDVVIKPSFEVAVVSPHVPEISTSESKSQAPSVQVKEGAAPDKAAPSSVFETVKHEEVKQDRKQRCAVCDKLKETECQGYTDGWVCKDCRNLPTKAEEPARKESASAPIKESKTKGMNITEIKNQIGQMRSFDPQKLTPQAYAEGRNQLSALHQEVASYVAEDGKRSWDGQQLHEQITAIEKTWDETQLAPGKQAIKLKEDTAKLMKVVKAVAQTGLTFKKRLGESIKEGNHINKVLEAVVARGKGWQKLADSRKDTAEGLSYRYNLATEALDLMANRYKADVTALGKRVVQLEFKEKAETEEIKKMLKEATKPKDILAIREKLDPKPEKEQVTEIKKEPEAKKVEEKKADVKIVSSAPADPRSLTEAVEMVKRLSATRATK